MVKQLFKNILATLVRDYAIYKIYSLPLTCEANEPASVDGFEFAEIETEDQISSQSPELNSTRGYFGKQSHGFGVFSDDELAAAIWFWYGARYQSRNFWPLNPGEAKLVQVTTGASFQKRGLGAALMNYAIPRMKALGFTTLYARIWHSNIPSIKLFEKTGWQKSAFVFEAISVGFKIRYEYYYPGSAVSNNATLLPCKLRLSRYRRRN